mmetsp:Transcript_19915/g.41711  ORF Transcript_19915/g.41711 Transcript_19915/m.41711 type:complete len:128 (+) Transcript_19915:150-533(+)
MPAWWSNLFFDEIDLFPQVAGSPIPVLIVDGHQGRLDPGLIRYINNKNHLWKVCPLEVRSRTEMRNTAIQRDANPQQDLPLSIWRPGGEQEGHCRSRVVPCKLQSSRAFMFQHGDKQPQCQCQFVFV